MIYLHLEIRNLDQLRANFHRAPARALELLSKAVKASILEIEKRADDSGDSGLFRFRTPRAMRSGYLALSFSFGRHFSPGGLSGSIGPTAHYAPHVYFGTSRGIASNPFMDRIAKDAEGDVNKHFEKAVDTLVTEIAKV